MSQQSFKNPATDPLLPFVYQVNPYPGNGPHTMAACFIALGVKVIFIVNCVQFDETLEEASIGVTPLTNDDLNHKGCFRRLPHGEGDDTYDAEPVIKAAFALAEEIALSESRADIRKDWEARLAAAIEKHYGR